MKKMLLLTAALLTALAGPALAQDRRGGDGRRGPDAAQAQPGGGGQRNFRQRDSAQAAQPNFNRGGGQRNFGQGNNAQAAQPNFNRGGGFAQRNNAPTAQQNFNRGGGNNNAARFGQGGQRDFNRGGGDNRFGGFRGNDNRSGFGGNNFGRNYGNQRYSQYYRSFNAQRRFRIGGYYGPSGYSYRRWSYGDILPSLYWSNRYWLNDYYSYDLMPPMPGTVWVRYGDDALLIDQYSGEVIQVAYGIFW